MPFQLAGGGGAPRAVRLAKGSRLGFALDGHLATVVQIDLLRPRSSAFRSAQWPIGGPVAGEGWPGLRGAVEELRRDPGCPASAAFALLHPLSRVKTLQLPSRLTREDARRLVEGGAKRFFPEAQAPLADAVRIRGIRTGGAPFLAAATEAPLIDELIRAVEASGLEIVTIVPGLAVIAAGATFLAPEVGRGEWLLVLVNAGRVEMLALRDGSLHAVRSLPGCRGGGHGAEPAPDPLHGLGACVERAFPEAFAESENPPRHILLVAEGITDEAARSVFGAERVATLAMDLAPGVLAAIGAAVVRSEVPVLAPDSYHDAARRRRQRRTLGFASAAAALFLAAGAVVWEDASRQVAAVEERRAVLRPAVLEGERTRVLLAAVERRGRAVEALDSLRSRKVVVLAEVARCCPPTCT